MSTPQLRLSVTKQRVTSKEQARTITEFEVQEFLDLSDPATQGDLKSLFRNFTYSSFVWEGNRPNKAKVMSYNALIFDCDDGAINMADAIARFAPYVNIITTSTNHQEDNPRHNGVQDRFRIILPYHPEDIAIMDNVEKIAMVVDNFILHDTAYSVLVDPACADLGRKYYPDTHSNPDHHVISFNTPTLDNGEPAYFRIDFQAIAKNVPTNDYVDMDVDDGTDAAANAFNAVGQAQPGKKKQPQRALPHTMVTGRYQDPTRMFSMDAMVTLKDFRQVRVRDITAKTECYCLFCDDLSSDNASAFIDFNQTTGFPQMPCSHCKITYHSNPITWLKDIVQLDDKFYRVVTLENNFKMAKVNVDSLLIPFSDAAKKVYKQVMAEQNLPSSELVEERLCNAYTPEFNWEIDRKTVTYRVAHTAIPTDVCDNDLIIKWLTGIYGDQLPFVLKWLAWYAYTDFVQLPVLVFTGERGTGKNTFFEWIASWFPNSFKEWNGNTGTFNDWQDAKLIVYDEATFNKQEQYIQLKKLTGGADMSINKKYGLQFKLRNNMHFIVTTNQPIPMYITPTEFTEKEEDNQFFVHKFPDLLPGSRNTNIKNDLRERSGHFIRTILKDTYEECLRDPNLRTYRYSVKAPITPHLRAIISSCLSGFDHEYASLKDILANGTVKKSRYGSEQRIVTSVQTATLTYNELTEYVHALPATPSRPIKSYINNLVADGILTPTANKITYNFHKGKL